ncbi:hypothetical protein EOJ36_10910 [Sandaracinomonas limnophila]|uniref:Uncharacterized protein n=1 Tax=Sandaracinomonas limnophila TaxID=1862386 RepID=A0A437PN54_9BACT|nr:hypothetical protein [Sandaracinomonas limnophila]RVU23579.1 hypothetical protein EOJ36_10910 [Sandaracinomonas limnophila]
MEVHHPHHIPKKLKEYLTEFLMLFAAVTLGFFAENLREHYVEKEREEKFIQIVHEDLLNDINSIRTIKEIFDLKIKREDTLISLLSNFNPNQTNDLYFLARSNSIREFFHHSKNGFQQLKNAGGLRLIEDISVIKKIQAYENMVEDTEELQSLTENLLMNYREKMSSIFNGVVFAQMINAKSTKGVEDRFLRPTGNPELLQNNKILMNEFLIKALYVHNNNLSLIKRLKQLQKNAIELDEMLKEKYHF